MKRRTRIWKIFVLISVTSVLLPDCVQQYVSPYKSPVTGYLVVDGYISGNTTTQFTLSRSIPLPGDSTIPQVTGASLQVEGTDGSTYPLAESGGGVYATGPLPLSTAYRYRLRISIPNGETYLSDYAPYKPTPPIDSVNWIQGPDGVIIYVNTHDPANSTRYYQWSYDQTYEYHSAESTGFMYVRSTNSIIPRTQDVFTCWKDIPLSDILVGSSDKLAQDHIYEYPLLLIPANSQQLSVEYSILVTQYALSDSGYNFLSLMAHNSQSLGSIFDSQPSQLTGNIHSLSNPDEPVIGFIDAGTVQQQRIFISFFQLNSWSYYNQCGDPDIIVPNDPDSIRHYFGDLGLNPLYQNFGPRPPVFGWYANQPNCTDCTTQGGTTQKPSYWPN